MPIYEYVCPDCKERFEAWKSIEERKESTCLACEGMGQQVLTPVAFDTARMGCDPAFPTFYDKWAKRHEKSGEQLRTTGKPRPD